MLALGLAVVYFHSRTEVSSEEWLFEARSKLVSGDYQQAEEFALRAARRPEPSPWAMLVAAEAAVKNDRFADALGYYRQAPRNLPVIQAAADFGEAEMLCHLSRLSESETLLRQILARDPQHQLAHYRLVFLLNITGRRWEAQSHLLFLVRHRAAEVEHLLLLGNSLRQVEDRALLDSSAQRFPNDPLPKLGAARLAMSLNQLEAARPLFEEVLQERPNEPETVVGMGQLCLDAPDPNAFIRWSMGLTAEVERHPEVWMLRGQFALRNQQLRAAVRCFWEACRRAPEHLAACHQLGRTLADLNDVDRAAPFLRRAEFLQSLSSVLDDLFHHRDHLESMRRAALLTRETGRMWESASWSSIAMSIDPTLSWPLEILQELSPRLIPTLPQTSPEKDLSREFDLADFPLPDWKITSSPVSRGLTQNEGPREIRFQNRAQTIGLDFRYLNAADDTTPGARIFETTGGGVGAIDYDCDGWPDLYLTQGGHSPNSQSLIEIDTSDRLYRNESGQRLLDVTLLANLGDRDFSQGVAVGDFDNDGFPDLYVANLGQNRLLQNQGDGTFRDLTIEAGIQDLQWTTSCLMADLNGDGLPDLYDVNYCAGDSVLTRVCQKQGVTRSCSPRAFDAASDRVWRNLGDGHFRDVSPTCGIGVPGGYGLGIIALDLEGHGQISLFIANDEVPNFLFANISTSTDSIHFEERGLIAGVALDANGRSQACMGVAAGDADGDGLTDLLVTNFYHESSTLYHQTARGQFTDRTRTSGLRESSFEMLGFGTQFLDADLDGWEDLIVTNGHIDDLRSIGDSYKMPTQFFRNQGEGHFQEVPARTLGSFFQELHLGRGLARLDWNRDGLDDIAISLIGEPATFLVNETPAPGHYFAIQLRGTTSSRDAIGTTVEVIAGGRTIVKQLMAGDGYQASNERQLRFGLASHTQIQKLTIRWPSGERQIWHDLAADQAILAIENSLHWRVLTRGLVLDADASSSGNQTGNLRQP